jgi:hypothetical protein
MEADTMATFIASLSVGKSDCETLLLWATQPQQQTRYPDLKHSLYVHWSRKEDRSNQDVPYLHLRISRDKCEGLYIRLNKANGKRSPEQLWLLRKKEQDGYAVANCFGWEDATDAINQYMGLRDGASHLYRIMWMH